MSRGLTADQVTRLSTNPYRVERLIEILTPGANYFYTTGDVNVSASTNTSDGTKSYLANNGVELLIELQELYEPGANEMGVRLTDISGSLYSNITRFNNNYDYLKSSLNVYLLFRDVSTGSAYTSDIISLFQGSVYKIDANRDAVNLTLNVRANNLFANFVGVKGRSTSFFYDGMISENIAWGR
jgi:hypothetical protein